MIGPKPTVHSGSWGPCTVPCNLEISLIRAREALLDRRVFVVSLAEYDAFAKALGTPGSKERLEKLLATPVPWER